MGFRATVRSKLEAQTRAETGLGKSLVCVDFFFFWISGPMEVQPARWMWLWLSLLEVLRCMVYTERAETAAVSCGTSQVESKQRRKYTTSVDIVKNALYKINSLSFSHLQKERGESTLERRTALYKRDQQQLSSSPRTWSPTSSTVFSLSRFGLAVRL